MSSLAGSLSEEITLKADQGIISINQTTRNLLEFLRDCITSFIEETTPQLTDTFQNLIELLLPSFAKGDMRQSELLDMSILDVSDESCKLSLCSAIMKHVLRECSKKFQVLKSDERAQDELYDLLSFMKWFLKKSFCENKFLHDDEFIAELLTSSKTTIKDDAESFPEIVEAVMKLISFLLKTSTLPGDLYSYFSMFNDDSPPNLQLLEIFSTAMENAHSSPSYFLEFPSHPQEPATKLLSKRKFSIPNGRNSYFDKKHENKFITSPKRTLISTQCELGWFPKESAYIISLWVQIEGWAKITDRQSKSRAEKSNSLLLLGCEHFCINVSLNYMNKLSLKISSEHFKNTDEVVFDKISFKRGRWHCLSFSFRHNVDKNFYITKCLASLDGREQLVKVDCKSLTDLERIKVKSNEINLSIGESTSCNDVGLKYNLGNFHLFHRENFGSDYLPGYHDILKALGPNRIIYHSSQLPPANILYKCFISKSNTKLSLAEMEDTLEKIKSLALYIYSPTYPDVIMHVRDNETKSIIQNNKLEYPDNGWKHLKKCGPSLYASLLLVGGIKTIMFLCAKVVESSADEGIQCDSFSVLFKILNCHVSLAEQFHRLNGNMMMAKLFSTSKCVSGYKLLKILLEFSTNHGLSITSVCHHTNTPSQHHTIQTMTTNAFMVDLKFVLEVLLDRRVWNESEDGVWFLIFEALQLITSKKSRAIDGNILQMSGIFTKLLTITMERLNDERDLSIPSNKGPLPSPIQSMSQVTCNKYCQVFMNFIERTLDTKKLEEYFYEITKSLLLFHPTTQTFISHRPTSFYWSNSWVKDSSSISTSSSFEMSFEEDIRKYFNAGTNNHNKSNNCHHTRSNEILFISTGLLETLVTLCEKMDNDTRNKLSKDATIIQTLFVLITSEHNRIRTASIKVLKVLLVKSNKDVFKVWSDYGNFHMLANQLHRIEVDGHMLELIIELIFPSNQSSEVMKFRDILTPSAILLLLGPLEHLDSKLSLKVIDILCWVYDDELVLTSAIPEVLLSNGVVNVLCNKLLLMDRAMQNNSQLIEAILSLIGSVACHAFFSSKTIHEHFFHVYHLVQRFEHSNSFPFGWGRNMAEQTIINTITSYIEKNFLVGYIQRKSQNSLVPQTSYSTFQFASSGENMSDPFTSSSCPSLTSSSLTSDNDDRDSAMDYFIDSNRMSNKNLANKLECFLKLTVESSLYMHMPNREIQCNLIKFILRLNSTYRITNDKCFIYKTLSRIQKTTSILLANLVNFLLYESRNDENYVDYFLSIINSNPHFLKFLSNNIVILWLKANLMKYTKDNFLSLSPDEQENIETFEKLLQDSNKSLNIDYQQPSDKSLDLKTLLDLSQYKRDFELKQQQWNKKTNEEASICDNHLNDLSKKVSLASLRNTQDIVSLQMNLNQKFQIFLQKTTFELASISTNWRKLIDSLVHERAIWHRSDLIKQSWMLDETEGPNGVRMRTKRCHINLPKVFFTSTQQDKSRFEYCRNEPLQFLFSDATINRSLSSLAFKLHHIHDIEYTTMCNNIAISSSPSSAQGNLFIIDNSLFFIANDNTDTNEANIQHEDASNQPIIVNIQDTSSLLKHRHLLRDNCLQISLKTGQSYLFAFQTLKDRDDVRSIIIRKRPPNLLFETDIQSLAKKWTKGKITNFEYLMKLNSLSGRLLSDITQYPIFPYIFSSYNSKHINLNDPSVYRNLEKNIFAQTPNQEKNKIEMFTQLEQEMITGNDQAQKPAYHCHNFPMNAVVVLYYHLRLPPFTQLFVEFQGGQFDYADRIFSSIGDCYRILTSGINNDTKELTPEFFYFPEILENSQGFNFGRRQNGTYINNVVLPPWSAGNARTFIFVHRQALESDYVSMNLPSWIDLVFGFKQRGKPALSSLNVYHKNAYGEHEAKDDDIETRALLSHIRTCGQVPKQLFTSPHPFPSFISPLKKSPRNLPRNSDISGLRWGKYVGSPESDLPFLVWNARQKQTTVKFVSALHTNIFALSLNKTVIKEQDSMWTAVHWNRPDRRIKLTNNERKIRYLNWSLPQQKITRCESIFDESILIFGTESGILVVYHLNTTTSTFPSTNEGCTFLYGHKKNITDIKACTPFRLFFSSSADGIIHSWDLNSLNFVRCIKDHNHSVNALGTSPTLGDLVSASYQGSDTPSSILTLHNINGKKIAATTIKEDKIKCLIFSSRTEGRNINIIAAGLKSGNIRFYSSWDLTPLREIVPFGRTALIHPPVLSLSYCMGDQQLIGSTKDNDLFLLSNSREVDLEELKITYI